MGKLDDRKYPDIQSIESRLNKIEEQLALYEGKSVYSVTRRRLADVKAQLEKCLSTIDAILIGADYTPHNISYSSVSTTEVDSSNNLSDLLLSDFECDLISEVEQYKPKYIMATYRKKFNEMTQVSSGILQVNQVINVMNLWFQKRYSVSPENSNFRYKADRVHEWIDLVIIAAGYALSTKMFAVFRSDLEEWINSINTDTDRNWILPKNIMRFHKSSVADYTEEAILLERIIKYHLYDDEFYPSLKDSIEKIVICSGRFGSERLSTSQIVEDCKGSWIVTSNFNPAQY